MITHVWLQYKLLFSLKWKWKLCRFYFFVINKLKESLSSNRGDPNPGVAPYTCWGLCWREKTKSVRLSWRLVLLLPYWKWAELSPHLCCIVFMALKSQPNEKEYTPPTCTAASLGEKTLCSESNCWKKIERALEVYLFLSTLVFTWIWKRQARAGLLFTHGNLFHLGNGKWMYLAL